MTISGRTIGIASLFLGLLIPLAFPPASSSQETKQEWLRKFKSARYVVFCWEGSIDRYQLSLLQDSLKGETIDAMISWREKAKAAVADLKGCHPQYQKACELLNRIIELLGKQESLCTGRAYIMAHLEEWRSNKEAIKQLHKELDDVLKL